MRKRKQPGGGARLKLIRTECDKSRVIRQCDALSRAVTASIDPSRAVDCQIRPLRRYPKSKKLKTESGRTPIGKPDECDSHPGR